MSLKNTSNYTPPPRPRNAVTRVSIQVSTFFLQFSILFYFWTIKPFRFRRVHINAIHEWKITMFFANTLYLIFQSLSKKHDAVVVKCSPSRFTVHNQRDIYAGCVCVCVVKLTHPQVVSVLNHQILLDTLDVYRAPNTYR